VWAEGSGHEYAGSAVLAWVAWHDRMWNGESIEISKCRLFDASWGSGLESRMTICQVCQHSNGAEALGLAYLDPMMDLDILVGGVEMQS
jgi:hypothetical protein